MADSADPAPTPPTSPAPAPERNPLKCLYHWILSWANHPWGSAALAVFAFLDSFVFPIPPLFLQIALSLERPKRSFWYALVDTVPSVLGAAAGWYIGHAFWDSIGAKIIGEVPQKYQDLLHQNQFFWTFLYSFVPMPFKIITLGSGLLNLSLPTLLLASTLGRSTRFFGIGVICFFYGKRAKDFIERHFNRVCLISAIVLALIVVAVKVLWKR
ncbi:MAG TPA: VTT domain-containing protein [Planctomycetota bacterium]|nr:VTT domain-containing protein [Planctomycetota bacterium]